MQDSEFYRVHQVVATSTFRLKSSGLYLADQFLQFLNSLPLEYNYALYRQIFQLFGTHYFSSGTLGGKYDLLFQYDREELKTYGKQTLSSDCNTWSSCDFIRLFSLISEMQWNWNAIKSPYDSQDWQNQKWIVALVRIPPSLLYSITENHIVPHVGNIHHKPNMKVIHAQMYYLIYKAYVLSYITPIWNAFVHSRVNCKSSREVYHVSARR